MTLFPPVPAAHNSTARAVLPLAREGRHPSMNSRIEPAPLAELAQCIAATQTLGDLQDVRRRLRQTALLDDDRAALETALAEREAFLARLYLL